MPRTKPQDCKRHPKAGHNASFQCRGCKKENRRKNYDYMKIAETKYGITSKELLEMYGDQQGACAICREPFSSVDGAIPWRIDHSHKTREIRGLLCDLCNRGLGFLGDNPDRLEAAAKYLRKE